MCLNPIKIKNPSKHVSPLAGRLSLYVRCGKCAECRKEDELSWQHRCHAEFVNTQKDPRYGYTFFETLTYNEGNVPMWNGLRVFNREHIKKFRNTLRNKIIQYKQDGKYIFRESYKSDFRLIITSEYGGLTHRPHYHMLIFCKIPMLHPFMLQKWIRESWTFGNTDISKTINQKIVNGTGVLTYVSKYMYKDDDFVHELDKKIKELNIKLLDQEKRNIYPFHVQSIHFGLCMIEQIGEQVIYERGTVTMPDKERIVSEISVPMYIQRHLFYDCVDDFENLDEDGHPRKRWILNEKGIKFKMLHLDKSIVNHAESILNKVNEVESISKFAPDDNNQRYVHLNKELHDLLGQRSIVDYSIYSLVYRGNILIQDNYDYQKYYENLISSSKYTSIKDSFTNKENHYLGVHDSALNMPCFFEFEKIDLLLNEATKWLNQVKNDKYFEIRHQKSRLKLLTESHLSRPEYLYNNIDKLNLII